MRIGYYLHHQGQGHRRRGTAVARALLAHGSRVAVTGLGTGAAPDGWPGEWVSLAPDDDPAVGDPDWADVTAGEALHWVPRHHPGLLERQRQIVEWLARERPALMIVDVSVEVTLLARLCGIPVVVGAMPGDRADTVHALAYDVAEALLAPWPYAAHPDAGWPADWWEKTWHVGGISALAGGAGAAGRRDAEGMEPRGAGSAGLGGAGSAGLGGAGSAGPRGAGSADERDRRRVLVVWGGGGEPLDQGDLERAQEGTPGWEWTVRGGGHPPAEDLAADLAAADVVVSHAGQGSVADIAWARRPAVVLAQPRPYEEQDATVHALDRLGLAVTAYGWPRAHRWPGLLERALELGGDGWSAWGADGAERAVSRIVDLARRVGPAGPVETAPMLGSGR